MLQPNFFINKKNKKENKVYVILLTAFFVSLSLSVVNIKYIDSTFSNLARFLSLFSIILFISYKYIVQFSLSLFFPKENLKKFTLYSWFLFGVSVYLSEVINQQVPTAGIGYIIFVPILFFLMFNKSILSIVYITLKAIFYSQFLIVLYSLVEVQEWNTTYYFGVTNNSNNMGLIAFYATFSGIFIILFKSKNQGFSLLKNIPYGLSVIISLSVLFQTGSRTPLVALISAIIFYIAYLIFSNNIKFRYVIISFISFGVAYSYFLKELFEEFILSKFRATSSAGDLLSGRGVIWSQVMEEATLFGHGESYFENKLRIASHNIFIQILGEYGLITVVFFSLFIVVLVLLSIKEVKKNDEYEYIIIFIYILTYLFIGFGESIFGVIVGVPTTVLFLFTGYLVFSRKVDF